MRIQINVSMTYSFAQPNTLFLALEAAQTEGQQILSEVLDPYAAEITRIAGDAGVGQRVWARLPLPELRLDYMATLDVLRPRSHLETCSAAPLFDLPAGAAPYLRPSRYCQSDKFGTFVQKRFGHLRGGAQVAAIRDWIEANLSYVPGASDADTNVLETFAGRQGVCRDYAHLMCSMVRAARIPARMVAVYSPYVTPMDFHAVTQVWLDDAWHLVDATGMCQPDDMAIIAVGRDAYDIAFLDSESPAELVYQDVRCWRV